MTLVVPGSNFVPWATHFLCRSVPHEHGVAAVEEILHYAGAHDAQPQEPEPQLARLYLLVLQGLGHATNVQRGRVLEREKTVLTSSSSCMQVQV